MPSNSKKKKKPVTNSARGFATISVQSKSKADTAVVVESADASASATPDSASKSSEINKQASPRAKGTGTTEHELHELTPEELEARLEQSELQHFVDKFAAKVRKDSTRQVSRLQTDKRLLRNEADYISVREWLPDELTAQIIEFIDVDHEYGVEEFKKAVLPIGDDLIAKIWQLRACLVALDFPPERIDQAIGSLLRRPPADDSSGQFWGLTDALDWLALHSEDNELLGYEAQKQKLINAGTVLDDDVVIDAHISTVRNSVRGTLSQAHDSAQISSTSQSSPRSGSLNGRGSEGSEMSDLDSDVDPSELVPIYLDLKGRLYGLDPFAIEQKSNKSKNGSMKSSNPELKMGNIEVRRLQNRIKKIESDSLFDKADAEALWSIKKVEIAREAAERRKLQLHSVVEADDPTLLQSRQAVVKNNGTEEHLSLESENSDDEMFGGMFGALPEATSSDVNSPSTKDGATMASVTIKEFGKITGVTPRRILEEFCKARDSRSKISFRQISPTTYSCRHSVTVEWSKEQEIVEHTFLPSIKVSSRPKTTNVAATSVAATDVFQSESYAATAALFVLTSGAPKEEKTHLRLPPAFREVWDEFAALKREHIESLDRVTVEKIRALIDENTRAESESDDEVVFNISGRLRSGVSTPTVRPQTPRIGEINGSQALLDKWNRIVSTESYRRMLPQRMALPMFQARETTLQTIEQHQITIVVGDTGSGKSTQLPQYILENELSHGRPCKIYCTEPRRISAMSLAYRVSEELGESKREFGTAQSLVGYAVRLDSKIGAATKLVYATVGIILRMLESDDGLQDITHLCLDEVHERSIDSDFLLIILKSLLLKRRDLKVVLMSATVDAQKFSQYLDGAPIISVGGRTFPVQAKFLEDAIEITGYNIENAASSGAENDDLLDDSDKQDKSDHSEQLKSYSKKTIATLASFDEYRTDHRLIVELVEKIAHDAAYAQFSKAVLIFLPGIAEIRQLHDALGGHPSFIKGWRIHALHSTFSSEEQQAAFEIPPAGVRKIVLATNIAETGITIPDVTCVIDTGKHREMRFDERRQMSRLIQSFIARANAKQRRGRAGRVQEGICFHLFTRHRFEHMMVEQQTPEMLRLSLQELVMRVKICKLGDIEATLAQALDPPSSKNIRRAIDALVEVGALTPSEQLTALGRQLAKLPLDAQLGKLILFGTIFGCLDFALTTAAAVGAKSPFVAPMHSKKQADSVRLGYKRGDSDLLTLYNAYTVWRKVCTTPGLSEHTFCKKNFLSSQNLANIEDIKAQLLNALLDAGFVIFGPEERAALAKVRPGARHRNFVSLPAALTRADANDLVAASVVAWAFYPKIAKAQGMGWRNIANNQTLALHPTSVNKLAVPNNVKFLSFYSIMQSSSRFTNAQETTPVSDFALVLLAGEAVFHMYAGVIAIDGNRLRFKVRDWKTMIVLKELREKLREALGRVFKYPGKQLGDRQKKWLDLLERIFEERWHHGRPLVH